jgi:hypothetical protein
MPETLPLAWELGGKLRRTLASGDGLLVNVDGLDPFDPHPAEATIESTSTNLHTRILGLCALETRIPTDNKKARSVCSGPNVDVVENLRL